MNITIEQLIQAIQDSTFKYKIATKSEDYYARSHDVEISQIDLINPHAFVTALEMIVQKGRE